MLHARQPIAVGRGLQAIVTDLICKYIVGLTPRPGGGLEVAPLAMNDLDRLTFGPYNYGGKWFTVNWLRGSGYDLRMEDGAPAGP